MKTFVQFRETRTTTWINKTNSFHPCEPYEVDCMGSVGVFILDGRNSIENLIEDAKKQVSRLHNIKPWISSFRIMRGDRIDRGTILTEVKVECVELSDGIHHTFTRVR